MEIAALRTFTAALPQLIVHLRNVCLYLAIATLAKINELISVLPMYYPLRRRPFRI